MGIVKHLPESLVALGELFFPPICQSCGTHLFKNESEICQMCIRRLPRTYFEKTPAENQITIQMWGRCHVEYGTSLFFYKKGERVQRLLHDVKYRGNIKLGEELGRQLGKMMKQNHLDNFDYIIPIPLHPKKQKLRGFNQAEVFAKGLAEILMVDIETANVCRITHTSSQTRKGRFERWQNVESIFRVDKPDDFKNKHLLVIDDVITTGSTMEACVNQLTPIDGVKVSVASIACAAL